jgi:RNA polymerase sigma factor (sigma-70 family)
MDEHFTAFVDSLKVVILGHGGENTTPRQKAQVENLVKLETQFRRALIRHRWGPLAYRDFIGFILDERRNILEARPFFRERNSTFTSQISDLLRNRSARGLYRFHFNYQFIRFVMKSRPWGKKSEVRLIHDELIKARQELIEMNMPLAMSQARMFYGKMQKSHLDLMDFIQIASEGLIAAIDKFCLPYTTVFRTVATHRMKGNFIDCYSETSLHFYPKDRRRLYQAYKWIKEQQGKEFSYEDLVTEINKRLKPNEATTVEEIVTLIGAASVVSANGIPVEMDEGQATTVLERYESPSEDRPDRQFEEAEANHALSVAMEKLTCLERKFLKLKGIQL